MLNKNKTHIKIKLHRQKRNFTFSFKIHQITEQKKTNRKETKT